MGKSKLKKALAGWQRQNTRIIALAGPRKSGKDVATKYIKKNYPVRHFRIADAPMYIAKILGLKPDRKIYHALFGVNKLLYPIIGESVYKRRVANLLDAERPKLAIVEAIRTKEEYREFVIKRNGLLIGITAKPAIRYQRALQDKKHSREKQDEGKMTFREFIGNPKTETGEYSPIEKEVSWILRHAHFVIQNNFENQKPVYEELEKILRALGLKKKR